MSVFTRVIGKNWSKCQYFMKLEWNVSQRSILAFLGHFRKSRKMVKIEQKVLAFTFCPILAIVRDFGKFGNSKNGQYRNGKNDFAELPKVHFKRFFSSPFLGFSVTFESAKSASKSIWKCWIDHFALFRQLKNGQNGTFWATFSPCLRFLEVV